MIGKELGSLDHPDVNISSPLTPWVNLEKSLSLSEHHGKNWSKGTGPLLSNTERLLPHQGCYKLRGKMLGCERQYRALGSQRATWTLVQRQDSYTGRRRLVKIQKNRKW